MVEAELRIEARRLTKYYGRAPAVDRFDLSVAEGEFVSLLGPSGCGKTTTLRCIAGLEAPSAGEVYLDGQLVSDDSGVIVPPQRRGLGMVFQSFAVWPHMTVSRNVGYPLRRRKLEPSTIRERVATVLSLVGMGHLGERYPSELSGGQQQRVALARAIVGEPRVVLYDEPLSNLDAQLRVQLRAELRSLHDKLGIAALYVTHDQEEAIELSDRIYVLSDGRSVQSGTPSDLYHHPDSVFVAKVLGDANVFAVAEVRPDGLSGAMVTLQSGDKLFIEGMQTLDGCNRSLVVRPHEVELIPPGNGRRRGTSLDGTIVDVVNLGARTRVAVATENGLVFNADCIMSPPGLVLEAGERTVAFVSRAAIVAS